MVTPPLGTLLQVGSALYYLCFDLLIIVVSTCFSETEEEVPQLRRSARFQLRIEPGDFVIQLPVSFSFDFYHESIIRYFSGVLQWARGSRVRLVSELK